MAKGFNIIPNSFSTGENGDTVILNVSLTAPPTEGRFVTINFSSTDTTEGTISGSTITFDSSNWNTAKKIIVTGQNDYLADGNISYFINATIDPASTDVDYRQMVINSIGLINEEDVTSSIITVDTPRIPANTPVDTPLKIYGDSIVDTNVIDPKTGLFKVTGSLYANDILQGLDGNDTLYGGNYQDDLSGGKGNDALYGENDEDFLYGQDGNDTLFGGSGVDSLTGGDGNDVLDGGAGDLVADIMIGGAGNDTYYLGYGEVDVIKDNGLATDIDTVIMPYNLKSYTLTPGIENGTIAPGSEASSLTGNNGDNTLMGNDGANKLNGGLGDDTLNGGKGNDTIAVGTGADAVDGGIGNDKITAGTDSIGDTLAGGAGNDSIAGGSGNDTLVVGTGADVVDAGAGNDKITAGTDSVGDNLAGGAGNDTVAGGSGADKINGGVGRDSLFGGTGSDTFVFDTIPATDLVDKIADFSTVNDTIQLENAVFTSLTIAGTLTVDNFVIGTISADLNDYIVYNPDTGVVSYDGDGAGAGAAVQVAAVGVDLSLSNTDFIVV